MLNKARKLNIIMFNDEVLNFNETLSNRKWKEFAEQYVNQYPDQSLIVEDVVSLALMQAIAKNNVELIDNILTIAPTSTILTTIDNSNYSAISYLLYFYNESIAEKIKSYLASSQNDKKVELNGSELAVIQAAARLPQFGEYMNIEDNLNYMREHFLNYLYIEQSLDHLQTTFLNTINGHYISNDKDKFTDKQADIVGR